MTAGLYLYQTGPLDSIWEQSFPALLPKKDQNYSCLQQLLEHGPRIIPGLETEYAHRAAESKGAVPPLPKTGADIAPALVFIEPLNGRDYLLAKITQPGWSTRDIAVLADSIWPRRSDAVRRVLMSRLAKRPKAGEDVSHALSQLVRFSRPTDFDFVHSRLNWTEASTAQRLRLSLLSKNGEIDPVARALGSKSGAEYIAAADALLQWGHSDLVCAHLKVETDARRANGIAGRYTTFRRGDYFEWLPDDVIAVVQRAPQAWECFPPSIEPTPFNAPRDTSKDPATRWNRPPLGGDALDP